MFVRIRQLVQWRPPRWTRGWIGLLLFGALFIGHTVALAAAGRLSGTLIKSLPIVPRATRCWLWPRIEIYRTSGGYRFVHWYDRAMDQPWFDDAEFVEAPTLAARFYWAPQHGGMWTTTRTEWDTRWPSVWTAPELEPEVRRLAHAWMLAEYAEYNAAISPGRAEWLRRYQAGPARTVDIIWTGYLHNLLACILFGMSARASLHTFGDAARGLHHRLQSESFEAAIARGHCPGCRYDIRGLPASICPECGGSLAPPGDDVAPDA